MIIYATVLELPHIPHGSPSPHESVSATGCTLAGGPALGDVLKWSPEQLRARLSNAKAADGERVQNPGGVINAITFKLTSYA